MLKDHINLSITDTDRTKIESGDKKAVKAFLHQHGYWMWAYIGAQSLIYEYDKNTASEIYRDSLACILYSLNDAPKSLLPHLYGIIYHKVHSEYLNKKYEKHRFYVRDEYFLAQIPFYSREVLILHDISRLGFESIAQVLSISKDTVNELYDSAIGIAQNYVVDPIKDSTVRDNLSASTLGPELVSYRTGSDTLSRSSDSVKSTPKIDISVDNTADRANKHSNQEGSTQYIAPTWMNQFDQEIISQYTYFSVDHAFNLTPGHIAYRYGLGQFIWPLIIASVPVLLAIIVLMGTVVILSRSAEPNSVLWPVRTIISPTIEQKISESSVVRNSLDTAEILLRHGNTTAAISILRSLQPRIITIGGNDARFLQNRWDNLYRKAYPHASSKKSSHFLSPVTKTGRSLA